MNTINNFRSLEFITPFHKRVMVFIVIDYGSLRKFARMIGCHQTAVGKCLRDPDLYPHVREKIIDHLGFDPFREQDSDNKTQAQTRDFEVKCNV